MGNLKSFEILKTIGKLGSNFSFSMAFMVCWDTPMILAKSSWV